MNVKKIKYIDEMFAGGRLFAFTKFHHRPRLPAETIGDKKPVQKKNNYKNVFVKTKNLCLPHLAYPCHQSSALLHCYKSPLLHSHRRIQELADRLASKS